MRFITFNLINVNGYDNNSIYYLYQPHLATTLGVANKRLINLIDIVSEISVLRVLYIFTPLGNYAAEAS